MKRKIVSIMLSAAMVVSLTACGGSSASSASAAGSSAAASESKESGSSESSAAGTTITVMASQDWVEDSEQELGKKFEEETGIHVDYEIVPADQYQDLLLTRLNSGEGPDIWGAQSGFALATTYNVTENAVDLSNESWASAYSEFSAEQTGVDGVNYGLTYYDTTTDYYMVYNKKLFEAAGINDVPKTFDELTADCDKLLASGVTPIYEPVADGWHQTMLWTASAQVLDKLDPGIIDKLNKNEAKFADNENMKTMLDQLNTLAQKGYFGDNYMSDEFANAESYMASGEFAICMLKPGAISSIVANDQNTAGYTEDDFGLFLLPILDNQYLNIHPTGPSRFIYSGSKNIDAAKKYLEYIVQKDNIQYLIDNASDVENLPIDMGQTPEYSKTTLDFLGSYDDAHSGMVLQDVVKYFNEQWMDISANLAAMFTGDMTSEEVLQAIDDERAQLAGAAGDSNWN
ncbi:raffinose/stachyose/melibiose transport system substrate-binding protein [Lachnospiraceae bacterium]|nr:raffinose/stachyose/melibiose transport system substrate-binding protein [Lachnospiraceae bacterium]